MHLRVQDPFLEPLEDYSPPHTLALEQEDHDWQGCHMNRLDMANEPPMENISFPFFYTYSQRDDR